MYRAKCLLLASAVALGAGGLAEPAPGATPTLTTLYEFGFNGPTDGAYPTGAIAIGADGVIFGVTEEGGTHSNPACGTDPCGTAYSLTPPSSPGQAWTEQVLWNFGASGDGASPVGVALGSDGVLYGTALVGGSGFGTVFALTPPASPGGAWTEQSIWTFSGGPEDGAYPSASVVIGQNGVLYGVTESGGLNNNGAVFALTPPTSPDGAWTEAILWSFAGGPIDGRSPGLGMALGESGALYGTLLGGGAHNAGAIFSLTPPASQGGAWAESILYSFGPQSGGPSGPLALSGDALYGSEYGPPRTSGSAFRLSPPKAGGTSWTFKVFYSLPKHGKRAPRGEWLNGPLLIQQTGSILATTAAGGPRGTDGTILQLDPPAQKGQPWTGKVLYHLAAGVLEGPDSGLVQAPGGGPLYGTATVGTYGGGGVFSFTP